jgi:carboxymethylenebutenolidase
MEPATERRQKMQATQPIQTRDIICGGGMPGHLAVPAVAGKVPALILLHERYGLGSHTRGLADRFARAGFVCLAPNLFFKHRDQAALGRGDAHYDITDPEAAEYLGWALDELASLPQVDLDKIAVQGTCQTGRLPFVIAAERPIGAVLIWYGGAAARQFVVSDLYPRPYEEIIAASHCPVLGIFGELDHRISIDELRAFRNCLERYEKTFSIKLYGDAPHGFCNETMPGRYKREQAESGLDTQAEFMNEIFAPTYDKSRIVQRFDADFNAKYDYAKNVRLE